MDELKEILKRLKAEQTTNTYRQDLAGANTQQARLRFHTEPSPSLSLGMRGNNSAVSTFENFVKSLLPPDKFVKFASLFTLPQPNIRLTERIYDSLEVVFDGKNPVREYRFTDESLNADWAEYQKNNLKEPTVWRTKGWRKMQTDINSLIIVDMPTLQTSARPEPYFYWVSSERIENIDMLNDGSVRWVTYRIGEDLLAYVSETCYATISTSKAGAGINYEVLSHSPHGLGYCPAQFFWTSLLTSASPIVKKSPLSKELGNLDWLLFFRTSKKHLDLYAGYPIYASYEKAGCDYASNDNTAYCDGGYLRDSKDRWVFSNGMNTRTPCPVCGVKDLTGPGSLVEQPFPDDETPDIKDPIKIISIDRQSLDYNGSEEDRLEKHIYEASVGITANAADISAVNEKQLQSSYDSKTAVLNSLKGNFEAAQKFVDDTVCKLRYGDAYEGSTISYGTEFYIYSVADLQDQYDRAKKAGTSEAQLDAIYSNLVDTEYRNDPLKASRMKMLKHLEPLRHKTSQEVITLLDKGLVSVEDAALKVNFTDRIARFERETGTRIEKYKPDADFSSRVDSIITQIRSYGNITKQEPEGRER